MTTVRKTFAFTYVGDLSVQMHAQEPLHQDDWEQWLSAAQKRLPRCVLVVTEGRGPSAKQRAEMMSVAKETLGPKPRLPPVAVVTSSVVVRGIVTALNWLGYQDVRAFPTARWREALAFLGIERQENDVRMAVRSLSRELGIANPLLTPAQPDEEPLSPE